MAFINPTGEQFERFLSEGPDGPILMLNLLKFRDKAVYEEGQEEPARSGAEAYAVYSEVAMAKVAEAGGSLFFMSPTQAAVVGPDDEWDVVALVRYPGRGAFLTMVADPAYLAATHHRAAALADSRLIPLTPQD